MSALVLFKCCEHCPPAHALNGPNEHVYPCFEWDERDDEVRCVRGSQHAEAKS